MKYSIILPYYNRPSLNVTLLSFIHFYKDRSDYEVIIVEDNKNYNDYSQHKKLLDIIDLFKDKINIKHIVNSIVSYNPARSFNLGLIASTGKKLILSNPECVHVCNILDYIDKNENDNYKVFGCLLVDCIDIEVIDFNKAKFISRDFWYQHSQHRNEKYHFCSCIDRQQFYKIDGFDEGYSKGIGFDDNDLVKKIETNSINFEIVDIPYVYHIRHDVGYQKPELLKINKDYFDSKWKEK